MFITRRNALQGLGSAAACAAFTGGARAQADYPTRPVRLIVPFPAGGPTDVIARVMSQDLSVALGRTVILENKGGAGGNIGAAEASRATPDGYTLLFATAGTHAINASLYRRPGYDHLRDFAPVAAVATQPNLLLTHPSLPARDLAQFVAYAKSNPGAIQIAVAGYGSSTHMTAELLKLRAGIEATILPYTGGNQAMTDLVGGHVKVMIDGIATGLPHVRNGSILALGISGPERSDVLPGVPPIADTFPGFQAGAWYGIVAPRGTPEPIVERLSREVGRVLASDSIRKRYADLGATPRILSATEFDTMIREETKKWAEVVGTTGVKLE